MSFPLPVCLVGCGWGILGWNVSKRPSVRPRISHFFPEKSSFSSVSLDIARYDTASESTYPSTCSQGLIVTERDAFLASIAAAPDDDLPRLVFADWLEDRGDADRAAFIRHQISGQPAGEPREEWLGSLRGRVYHADYDRGMPEHIVIPAQDWIRDGEKIRRMAPVKGLSLLNAGRVLNDLIDGPHFRGIKALHLTGAMLGDDAVDLLARCRHLRDLTCLRLARNDVSDIGAADIADSPHFSKLEKLILRDNSITLAGAMFIMHSRYLPRLKYLDLAANTINNEGVDVIRGSRQAKAIDVELSEQHPIITWSRRYLAAK